MAGFPPEALLPAPESSMAPSHGVRVHGLLLYAGTAVHCHNLLLHRLAPFNELKTDYSNPIDQCNTLNPPVLPEHLIHAFFCIIYLRVAVAYTGSQHVP